jgi:hypothetical protein
MNSPQPIVMFRVLVVSFNLILLGAFLALSSLGADSGKRTRKPLDAHQETFGLQSEREHGCCNLQPNYVSCIGNLTSIRSLTSMHHFIGVISLLSIICSHYFAPRNKKKI